MSRHLLREVLPYLKKRAKNPISGDDPARFRKAIEKLERRHELSGAMVDILHSDLERYESVLELQRLVHPLEQEQGVISFAEEQVEFLKYWLDALAMGSPQRMRGEL